MKKLFLFYLFLFSISCNDLSKSSAQGNNITINLESFLLGEEFCSINAPINACLRFQSDKVYFTLDGEVDLEGHPFKIIKTIKEENLILVELENEKVINEFKVIHPDTITFKQRGQEMQLTKLYRIK